MKKIVLLSLLAGSAFFANAALQVPNFNELNLSNIVSNGYFHGNAVLVDANNDGNYEMIVKGRDLNNGWSTDIVMLSGDGFGFTSSSKISDPDGCSWERIVVPIDYNADGIIDLILANSWNAKLLQGDGTGAFSMVDPSIFSLEGEMSIDNGDCEKWYGGTMAVADFNNDGYPDILTICGNARDDQGNPTIFLNDKGTGAFTKVEDCGIEAQRSGTLTVGDFNRDGLVDLAVSGWNDNFGNDCIRLYKNNGNMTFQATANASFDDAQAGTQNGHIMFVDVNNDGWLDLFVTGESCPQGWAKLADIYVNNEGESFTKAASLSGVKCSGADWCDLNGDGMIDIVYSGESDNESYAVLALNNGDGSFTEKTGDLGRHRGGANVLLADFNNNNMPDMAIMGYNDNGSAHFQVFNGLCTRGQNSIPQAPAKVVAEKSGNGVVITWESGSDKQTAAEALAYNVCVKLKDGRVIANVAADFATGKLRSSNVNGALYTKEYRIEGITAEDIAEFGVQTIDGAKAASEFAKGTVSTSAVKTIEAADDNAPVEFFDLNGVRVDDPSNGVFIRRQGKKATKVIIKK